MGDTLSSIQRRDSMTIHCELRTDNGGKFAGLIPIGFAHGGPKEGREQALMLAQALIKKLGKGFNSKHHRLKVPGVPEGATDFGLHLSTHNFLFNGGPLPEEQVRLIQQCSDTFSFEVDLTDFVVLVGSPSNDASTGIIGYVGLLIKSKSKSEYLRAVQAYGGTSYLRDGQIPHVSICGWELKGFSTSSQARAAFGLITADGQMYPDGQPRYTANVFPSPIKIENPWGWHPQHLALALVVVALVFGIWRTY